MSQRKSIEYLQFIQNYISCWAIIDSSKSVTFDYCFYVRELQVEIQFTYLR